MFDLFSPRVAHADLETFLTDVNTLIVNPLIMLLFALALVFFLFGVFQFIANQENEEKKTAGKRHMLWGLVGLTIMFGVWGIMNMILKTLDIEGINPEEGKVEMELNYEPPAGASGPFGN